MDKPTPDGRAVIDYRAPAYGANDAQHAPKGDLSFREVFLMADGYWFSDHDTHFCVMRDEGEEWSERRIIKRFAWSSIVTADHVCNTKGFVLRNTVWQYLHDHVWEDQTLEDPFAGAIVESFCRECGVYEQGQGALAEKAKAILDETPKGVLYDVLGADAYAELLESFTVKEN
jgi:hypothetical protein